jgi:YD repeat-containing protein
MGSDALTSVCEVTGSLQQRGGTTALCGQDIVGTGYLTTYQYDTLGDLLQVNQAGLNARAFTYDSLSRLVTASNPESGTMSYAYDANGNLISRMRPAPNQPKPSATVTTNYVYDSLNRVTRKSYSDGVTPEVDFVYDQASAGIGGTQYSLSNANGRLAYAFTPNSTTDIYSYDLMGRTLDMRQCVTMPCTAAWDANQTYDLGGDLKSVGYNGGATLNYSYDTTQRLIGVTRSYFKTLRKTIMKQAI